MFDKISIAPMVDRTTRHFRNFVRIFNKSSTLYTEMITAQGILYGDSNKLLDFDEDEKKLVFQLATSNPIDAAKAIKIVDKYNYDEINLNCGCPSDRVSDNKMGAYLMSDINLTKQIITAVKDNTDKKITIKHRIGIDGRGILENDKIITGYDNLVEYVDEIHSLGINKFIIHARIAILKGLSPKDNRTIPPLDYEMVYKLKRNRPNLNIELNGGIISLDEVKNHLNNVDSVMIGRKAYNEPLILNELNVGYDEILEKLFHYVKKQNKPYHTMMHTLGLFHGTKYSKIWKNFAQNTKLIPEDILEFIKFINNK